MATALLVDYKANKDTDGKTASLLDKFLGREPVSWTSDPFFEASDQSVQKASETGWTLGYIMTEMANSAVWFGKFIWTLVLVSRPGFYPFTSLLYIMPGMADPRVLLTPNALCGLFIALLPLNLLTYSMNDYKDVDIDKVNSRKGGCHGAKASESDLMRCIVLSIVSCVVLIPVLTKDIVWSTGYLVCIILVNYVYNFGPTLSRVAFLDMIPPLGYLLSSALGSKVMNVPYLHPWLYVLLVLIALRTQLWFQRMDLDADELVGKRTTAVVMGNILSSLGVFFFLTLEIGAAGIIGCPAVQCYSVYSACVFALEIYFARKSLTMFLMLAAMFIFFYPVLTCTPLL